MSDKQFSEVERELLLTGYKALRDEICKKMDHRTSLLISSVTVEIAALGVGVERKSSAVLLLAAIFAFIFGMLTVFHGRQIGEVSQYIIRRIETPLTTYYPTLGWHGPVGATRMLIAAPREVAWIVSVAGQHSLRPRRRQVVRQSALAPPP